MTDVIITMSFNCRYLKKVHLRLVTYYTCAVKLQVLACPNGHMPALVAERGVLNNFGTINQAFFPWLYDMAI